MKSKASKSKKSDPEHSKRGRGRPPMNPEDKNAPMPLTLRLPPALLARLDALTALYGPRASVLRAALVEGVRVLEEGKSKRKN